MSSTAAGRAPHFRTPGDRHPAGNALGRYFPAARSRRPVRGLRTPVVNGLGRRLGTLRGSRLVHGRLRRPRLARLGGGLNRRCGGLNPRRGNLDRGLRRGLPRYRVSRCRRRLHRSLLGNLALGRRGLRRRRRLLGRPRGQQLERVAVVVIAAGHAHSEVQVRRLGRALAGRADRPDPLARGDLVASAHRGRRQMEVRGVEPSVGRADRDHQAGRPERARVADGPARRGADGVADRARDVDPAVLPGGVGIVAVAVVGQDLSLDRPGPVARRRRG